MVEYNITPRNFEAAKEKIREVSNYTYTNDNLTVSAVETKGCLFKAFTHKVTGEELNGVTGQLQEYLVDLNETDRQIICQLEEVYNTFEVLDKDYIQGIVMSIKSVEKTSNDLKSTQGKLSKTQADLKRTIENQEKTTKILSQKFGKVKHFENIDQMWADVQKNNSDIAELKAAVSALSRAIYAQSEKISNFSSNQSDSTRTEKHISVDIDSAPIDIITRSVAFEIKKQFNRKLAFAQITAIIAVLISIAEFIFFFMR